MITYAWQSKFCTLLQAFFAVIDGHGGCAAAEYVAENLGINIMKELQHVGEDQEHHLEQAIRQGYSVTDKAFLSQVIKPNKFYYVIFYSSGPIQ